MKNDNRDNADAQAFEFSLMQMGGNSAFAHSLRERMMASFAHPKKENSAVPKGTI